MSDQVCFNLAVEILLLVTRLKRQSGCETLCFNLAVEILLLVNGELLPLGSLEHLVQSRGRDYYFGHPETYKAYSMAFVC